MSGSEEEEYSAVFASLKHPIRRKILRILSKGPENFTDLQKTFMIESSHLTYHLEGLGNLLLKTKDGKYRLSSLGDAAVSMMSRVEEPPRAKRHVRFPKIWRFVVVALLVGIIVVSTVFYLDHQGLSNQYSGFREDQEALQEFFNESWRFGGVVWTDHHTVRGTIATPLLKNESYTVIMNGTATYESYTDCAYPWGHNSDDYSIYSLTDNATLHVLFRNPDRPEAYLDVSILGEEKASGTLNPTYFLIQNPMTGNFDEYSLIYRMGYFVYPTSYETPTLILSMKVKSGPTYFVQLPSKGRYTIHVEAPAVWNATEHYEMNYTMTLVLRGQNNSIVPFFAGNHAPT
jgi:DNA-binding transcriptional ArsR family regulator